MGSMTGNCRFYNIIGMDVQHCVNSVLFFFFPSMLCYYSFNKCNLLDMHKTRWNWHKFCR